MEAGSSTGNIEKRMPNMEVKYLPIHSSFCSTISVS